MNPSQADGRTLAGRYLAMLNDHDPDGVDGFVAVDYINHNPMVEDGREGRPHLLEGFLHHVSRH